MAQHEETSSPSWTTSFFSQTRDDVAKAVAAAAAAASTAYSPRPSVVFKSKDDSGSPLQKWKSQVSKVLKGLSHPTEARRFNYNPEILTSQKRQWASVQLQNLDHKSFKEPTRLFESMVVVGLNPNCDIQSLQKMVLAKKSEGSGKFRSGLSGHSSSRVEASLEPQVLFVYPPEKQLPMKYKDLLSFCFPGGVELEEERDPEVTIMTVFSLQNKLYLIYPCAHDDEVHAVERTPSMSELNEILLGQEHLKKSDMSFIFRLQVADSSTLYGCCILVEEIVQKPSQLVAMTTDNQSRDTPLSRHILTTQRCYCLLSRLPFFDLHFGVLNSIFTEERLDRLTKSIGLMGFETSETDVKFEFIEDNASRESTEDGIDETVDTCQSSPSRSSSAQTADSGSYFTHSDFEGYSPSFKGEGEDSPSSFVSTRGNLQSEKGSPLAMSKFGSSDSFTDPEKSKQTPQKSVPEVIWPLLRCQHYESSESCSSLQSSPSEGRHLRSDNDEADTEETSSSGQEDLMDHNDILEWAKTNKLGSLQIICEYYQLRCPAKGSTIRFQPLEHLQPLEFYRPNDGVLRIDGSLIDLRSCNTSLEMSEVYNELLAEEEAAASSVSAISCLCGSLRLENILTLFAGVLLEKHIVFVCSNLGILSASVLSIVPLIRPYRWQSLLMPVLPNDMLEFLDAPVPYVVGMKNKTSEVQSKLSNSILIDLNKNQVRASSLPQLPRQKELLSALSPYHSTLVGESYLGKKRPLYDCTDAQVEAAKGFLTVLRTYLDSLCSNLRSHTITNVQSNDDKVSLLLRDSFVDSFASRDRPFMRLFVDTQLFSVHTDLVLSFYQRD